MSNDKVDAAINQLNTKNIEIMRKLSSTEGSKGPESSSANTSSSEKSDLKSEMEANLAKIQAMRQTGTPTT